MKYLEGVFSNISLNKHPLKIKKIKFSSIPILKLLKEHAEDPILNNAPKFRPYVQIFNKKEIIYNSF